MVRTICPFSQPFPQLDLVAPWLTFGTLGPPSGSLLVPWAPFWFTFGTFCFPFGFLWLTFGTLFREIMKTFINSIHFHEISRLVNDFYEVSYFSRHNSEENTQQPDPRTPHPLLDPPLSPGPERNLAVGNFDPLRARRCPGRVSIVPRFLYLLVVLLLVYPLSLTL